MSVLTTLAIYRYLARDNTSYERADFLEMWYSMDPEERNYWIDNFKKLTE